MHGDWGLGTRTGSFGGERNCPEVWFYTGRRARNGTWKEEEWDPCVRGERSLETNFASAVLDTMSVSLHLFTLLRYKVHDIIFFSSYVRRRNRYLFSLLYSQIRNSAAEWLSQE